MKARPYQAEAMTSTYSYLAINDENGLVILPTGTGKSYLIGAFCHETVEPYPATRIIIATHSQELVLQNYQELIGMWPDAPAGIYSAGIGKRDVYHKILFVSIQSVYSKAFVLQRCDILLVDEAHTISQDAETMWGKFIKDLRIINPNMRVIGYTATAYRMDSGALIGENTLFKKIIYEYDILRAFNEGYLCPVIPKDMETKLNVAGVRKSNGEFAAGELERAVNLDPITKAAVTEMEGYGVNRKSWLVFSSGVDHAIAICEEIKARGYTCEVITGKTPKGERGRIINHFKQGKIQCLVNNKVLTTGFNAKNIDLIADMNPTQSAGLFVQKVGRGTRPIYAEGFDLETIEGRIAAIAASSKPNCLLLDFAMNLPHHGCIDQIKPNKPSEGGGIAPVKPCLGNLPDGKPCATLLHTSIMVCPHCGYQFPENPPDIAPTPSDHAVLSTQVQAVVRKVLNVSYRHHKGKFENGVQKYDTLRVEYMTEGFKVFKEWISIENPRGRNMARAWWKKRGGGLEPPENVPYCLEVVQHLKVPESIVTKLVDKYDRVIGYNWPKEVETPVSVISGGAPTPYQAATDGGEECPF